jgi:hypothetical protein
VCKHNAKATTLLIRDWRYGIKELQLSKSVEVCKSFPNAFCAILTPNRPQRSFTIAAARQYQIACTKKWRARWIHGISVAVRSRISSSPLTAQNINTKIYRSTILPTVSCGCETRSLTFRKESKLRMFDNRLLRKMSGENSIKNSFLACILFVFSAAQQLNSGLGRPTVEVSSTGARTHTAGRTPLKELSARRTHLYLHSIQQTQERNMHYLSGIRTRDPSNRADAIGRTATGIDFVLLTKCYSHYQIKKDEMGEGGHAVCVGERRGAYMVLMGKPEGMRSFGRPRCR